LRLAGFVPISSFVPIVIVSGRSVLSLPVPGSDAALHMSHAQIGEWHEGSRERGAKSVEQRARSKERGARGGEPRAKSKAQGGEGQGVWRYRVREKVVILRLSLSQASRSSARF
jgi:hypothetical protein